MFELGFAPRGDFILAVIAALEALRHPKSHLAIGEGAALRHPNRDGPSCEGVPFTVNDPYAAWAELKGEVQWAQRRASIGTSILHSGHFLVVGSAGAGALRMRETRALMGVTTKK